MRDNTDALTAELPTIESPTVLPHKPTQADDKARMGYCGPKARPRCEVCNHCESRMSLGLADPSERFYCLVGGFRVHRGSICGEFAA